MQSLTRGFDIRYNGPEGPLIAPNLHSAFLHPEVSDEALAKEVHESRIVGPYQSPPLSNVRCSGLGVVSKKDGGWRLIYHKILSAPVLMIISIQTLQYSTVDDAIKVCHEVGPGALLAKADLKNVFHLCPVRPEDWHLLGIKWRGQ